MPAAEAYVRTVVVNTYRSSMGRRWRAEVPTGSLPDVPSADYGSLVANRADLARALNELAPGQRAVVMLRFFADMTEQQTADALGCTVGTVKSQTSRAIAALRRTGVRNGDS